MTNIIIVGISYLHINIQKTIMVTYLYYTYDLDIYILDIEIELISFILAYTIGYHIVRGIHENVVSMFVLLFYVRRNKIYHMHLVSSAYHYSSEIQN